MQAKVETVHAFSPIYQAPVAILLAPNPNSFHQALHAAPHPGTPAKREKVVSHST
jgi:hypothetical protein